MVPLSAMHLLIIVAYLVGRPHDIIVLFLFSLSNFNLGKAEEL